MELEKLNKILSNLQSPNSKELEFVEKVLGHQGVSSNSYGEGVEGEEDVYYNIYKIKEEENLFLKVEFYTDSYGSNDAPRGVQFVRGVKKQITVYEYK